MTTAWHMRLRRGTTLVRSIGYCAGQRRGNNGVSERGGYPSSKKKLRQWYLRITEYADRLLEGLSNWSLAMQ